VFFLKIPAVVPSCLLNFAFSYKMISTPAGEHSGRPGNKVQGMGPRVLAENLLDGFRKRGEMTGGKSFGNDLRDRSVRGPGPVLVCHSRPTAFPARLPGQLIADDQNIHSERSLVALLKTDLELSLTILKAVELFDLPEYTHSGVSRVRQSLRAIRQLGTKIKDPFAQADIYQRADNVQRELGPFLRRTMAAPQ
jgi:hypothetical protein